jgi:histidine decarboxylase
VAHAEQFPLVDGRLAVGSSSTTGLVPLDPVEIDHRIRSWHRHIQRTQPNNLGFPGATDIDHSALAPRLTTLLNNVGDPADDGLAANHSKVFEREVVDFVADLLRAPAEDRWGYVTTGGTEGNLAALWAARRRYPYGVVYYSTAVHYSIAKALDLLGMAGVLIDADERGEMDYDDLTIQIRGFLHQPVIVVANIGTTMTEAVDDVRRICAVLARAGHQEVWIHADAALAGIRWRRCRRRCGPGSTSSTVQTR